VGRFRELLSELSQHTQFIVVTHNRNTVQAAGVIYGITMGATLSQPGDRPRLDQVGRSTGYSRTQAIAGWLCWSVDNDKQQIVYVGQCGAGFNQVV
jgi:hypothetical protein